jgi:hypothetical protein
MNGLYLNNFRIPHIRINWDVEASEFSENPNNWIFYWKGYTGSLKFGCYYLQYVPASTPFDHVWFEVLEAITMFCTWSDNR